MANNICWYNLEKYLIVNEESEKEKYLEIASDKVLELEALLLDDHASSNMFDTVAWFYFNRYKSTRYPKDLGRAVKYCMQIGERENYSQLKIMSFNMHRNHIQEIMTVSEK